MHIRALRRRTWDLAAACSLVVGRRLVQYSTHLNVVANQKHPDPSDGFPIHNLDQPNRLEQEPPFLHAVREISTFMCVIIGRMEGDVTSA